MAILHRKLASEAEAGGLATLYNCTNCDEYSYPSPPPPAAAAHTNHAIPYLVSAACMLGVAFLLLTTCTILLRHRCSRRRRVSSTSPHSNEDHQGPFDHPIWHIVTVGLPQSVINSIAAVSYKSCDGAIDGSDCSVCLTKFEDGDAVRLLPKCSHAFHLPCIDTWLRSHKNCPLCRAPVVDVDDSTPNSAPSESNPVGNSENPSEETAAADDDDVETWPVQVQGAGIAGIWKRDPVKRASSDVGENVSAVNEDMQPVRRSISLDSSAACEYEVNKPKVVNGEGSSEQQHIVEVEVDDKEGHNDSAISRMMKRSLSSLSPFRGSKSHSSSSTLPL